MTIVAVVVGEYLGWSRGIGYLIAQAEGVFDTTGVFAGMVVLAAWVLVVGALIGRLERRLLRWKPESRKPERGDLLKTPMTTEIGHVEAIFRYPVKSMAGERVDAANMGWHGIDGDRRLAFRRTQERNDFPWLSASKLPDLLLFTPLRHEDGVQADLPTHVRTPEGNEMAVFGEELAAEIERRHELRSK